ncbi:DUF2690 domain-containing protein [Sinomonas soli]
MTTTTRRRRRGFWLFAAIACTALLVAVSAGTNLAAPASASPIGYSPGIQSDPQQTGCYKDAVTVKTVPIVDTSTQRKTGIVEVRYSPHCETNWVRATSFIKGVVQKQIWTKEPLNGIEVDYGPGTSWSYQVKAPGVDCIGFDVAIVINPPVVTDGTAHGDVCG